MLPSRLISGSLTESRLETLVRRRRNRRFDHQVRADTGTPLADFWRWTVRRGHGTWNDATALASYATMTTTTITCTEDNTDSWCLHLHIVEISPLKTSTDDGYAVQSPLNK